MIDTERLKSIVADAAQLGYGQWPGAGHAVETWEKSPGNPVCAADIAVDRFLRRELSALLPSAGWLSEETADDPERRERMGCNARMLAEREFSRDEQADKEAPSD